MGTQGPAAHGKLVLFWQEAGTRAQSVTPHHPSSAGQASRGGAMSKSLFKREFPATSWLTKACRQPSW